MIGDEGVTDLNEKARWREAEFVRVRLRRLSQIIARPYEFIAFCDHDPRARVVKAEMLLDGRKTFDGGLWFERGGSLSSSAWRMQRTEPSQVMVDKSSE